MNKTTEALKLAEEALIKTMSVLEQAMKLIETPLGNDEWRDGRGAWGDANKALAFIREMLAYHSYTDPIKSNVSVDKAYLRGLRAGYSLGQMEAEVDLENPIQGVSSVEQRFRARVASYEKSIKEAEAAIREALAESKPAPDGRIPKTVFTLDDISKAAEMGRQAGMIEALAEPVKQEPVIDLSKIRHEDKCCYWDDEAFCNCGADSHEILKWYRKNNAAPVSTKREWVELTDYEIVRLYDESPMCDSEMIAFARAIIAAFKEKNK